MRQTIVTKAKYMTGLQCPKALWFSTHRKDLAAPFDSGMGQMEAGIEVGQLARQLYPNGLLVNEKPESLLAMVEKTKAAISGGATTLYEASAMSPDGAYAKADILVKKAEGWHLIEVKSSTSIDDNHIEDVALQYHVFQSAGYDIARCYLVLINNKYVRQGDIDISQLFYSQELTEQAKLKQAQVIQTLQSLHNTVSQNNEPVVAIGAQCGNPYECSYKAHCWKDVPEYSIFNLLSSKKKAAEVGKQIGSYNIDDLPDSQLPKKGAKVIELKAYRENQVVIDKPALTEFLKLLQYPLYFLDYETISHPIPMFDGTKPYQQVTFQFSLHIKKAAESMLEHKQFLHNFRTDPREEFIEKLIAVMGNTGSVIVYNQAFEEGCNNDLAEAFPQYAPQIKAINARMVDLLIPFSKRWAYHPAQRGSASIKKVLPAFTQESYEELEIANGANASGQYLEFMQKGLPEAQKEKLWNDLTAYCELDTYAMVKLLEVLNGLV